MKGVFIPNMEKPAECGHHIDKYRLVLSCPMASLQGFCRLQKGTKIRHQPFKKLYENCPLLDAEIGSVTVTGGIPIREAEEPVHVGYSDAECGREK